MTRILSRAFGVVALVGVTLALAACSAQTPEGETGATTVPGTEVGVAQISQPVTVSGAGVTRVVFPTQDLVTPAQQLTKMTKVETESGAALYVALGLMTKTTKITADGSEVVYVTGHAPAIEHAPLLGAT